MTRPRKSQSKLRKLAIAARRAMDDDARDYASSIICQRVIRSHEFISCKTLVCYLPVRNEVDPTAIIERAWRAKKRVFAPVTTTHGAMVFRQITPDTVLRRNNMGLWEPETGAFVAAKHCDLVITPVVAFDDRGHRIGMGSGYFDRCFSFLKHRRRWRRPKLIGLAFDCQNVEKITPNPWDIPVYQVFTEIR